MRSLLPFSNSPTDSSGSFTDFWHFMPSTPEPSHQCGTQAISSQVKVYITCFKVLRCTLASDIRHWPTDSILDMSDPCRCWTNSGLSHSFLFEAVNTPFGNIPASTPWTHIKQRIMAAIIQSRTMCSPSTWSVPAANIRKAPNETQCRLLDC